MGSGQLDTFVDEMIADLQNSLLFNVNDLRERIKQARPDPNDHQHGDLHALMAQLWDDISKNNGKQGERLPKEHQRRIETHMNEKCMNDISKLEVKLQTLRNMTKDNT